MHAGFLFDVSRQFLAERTVENGIGRANIGKGKRDVQNADEGVGRSESAHRMNTGLDNAGLHLLQDLRIFPQLSGRKHLHDNGTVGPSLNQALKHGRHGPSGIVEGIVLVEVVQFEGLGGHRHMG